MHWYSPFIIHVVFLSRRSLKVIVTSATLDTEKFSRYLFDCPIIRIPGRTFPVRIMHSKHQPDASTCAITHTYTMPPRAQSPPTHTHSPGDNRPTPPSTPHIPHTPHAPLPVRVIDLHSDCGVSMPTSVCADARATVDEAVNTAIDIHEREPVGDVLVFLTGQQEIERACKSISDGLRELDYPVIPPTEFQRHCARYRPDSPSTDRRRDGRQSSQRRRSRSRSRSRGGGREEPSSPDRRRPVSPAAAEAEGSDGPELPEAVCVLPLYGALPTEAQRRVFMKAPSDVRKIIVCTNIAETSVTVDGVRYVVDPGFVKQKTYDPTRGMEALEVVSISQVCSHGLSSTTQMIYTDLKPPGMGGGVWGDEGSQQ